MALSAGTHQGPYEISEALGAATPGSGEVRCTGVCTVRMRVILFLLLCTATVMGQAPSPANDWKTATPDSVGMDRARLDAMTAMIRRYPDWNIHAVLIERNGRLIYEQYFSGQDERWGDSLGKITFTRETKHDLRSISKSVTSALVGIALASGKIRSVDQKLMEFFPDYADKVPATTGRITIRDALTMSSGLQWDEVTPYTDPHNDEIVMDDSKDPIGYVLGRPSAAEPGTQWNYNGGGTEVLAAIVQRAVGEPIVDYARRVLFEPLGIRDFEWVTMPAGNPAAASGLRLRPRDLAKFGSLYLHEGKWNGRQVVPADWVRVSTQRHIAIKDPVSALGTHGYGYQWWHNCYRTAIGTLEVPTAVGNGQQRIFVVRQLGLVVTIMAGRYNDPSASGLPARLLLEQIIPAIRAPRVTPSAAEGCSP